MRHLLSLPLLAVTLLQPAWASEADRPIVLRDAIQQITQITLPQGERYDYQRDGHQRITNVVVTSSTAVNNAWSIAYNPQGIIVAITGPSGPVDVTGATAIWKGLSLVVTTAGKPDRVLLADPRDPAL